MARILSRYIKLSKPPIIFQFPDGTFLKKTLNFMLHFLGHQVLNFLLMVTETSKIAISWGYTLLRMVPKMK